MHAALSHPRIHNPKNQIIGLYDRPTNRTLIDHPKGPIFKTMGKGDAESRVHLLPEETLYLVERGTLDLRLRGQGLEGITMSLQACYAYLLGREALTLERYTVFAGLKRSGYVVQRGAAWYEEDWDKDFVRPREGEGLGVFARFYEALFGAKREEERAPLGPLVVPGFYRSYGDVYRLLNLIPAYDPAVPTDREARRGSVGVGDGEAPAHPRIRPSFYVWKPTSGFKKSAPPPSDFRVAVTNAREENFPVLEQLDELLQAVPYAPPPQDSQWQVYRRIKHGWRNVLLAVVDQGVVSYIRIADAGFVKERIYERRGRGQGGKRGGFGGRGRGRGRGR